VGLHTKQLSKRLLTRIGARVSDRFAYYLNATVNYIEVGRWISRHGFVTDHRFDSREKLFDFIAADLSDVPVLYLEFGVAHGESLRYWSRRLRHPGTKLHGFDTFEGLPRSWIRGRPAGHFSTGGKVPEIADDRVAFFKGLFEDTLPTYEWPSRYDRLLVNLDADLYSSTVFVLSQLKQRLAIGSYIYFDEFNHRADELRAFDEFVGETNFTFRLIATTHEFAHVAFERIG
jgi:O-methyltransferase